MRSLVRLTVALFITTGSLALYRSPPGEPERVHDPLQQRELAQNVQRTAEPPPVAPAPRPVRRTTLHPFAQPPDQAVARRAEREEQARLAALFRSDWVAAHSSARAAHLLRQEAHGTKHPSTRHAAQWVSDLERARSAPVEARTELGRALADWGAADRARGTDPVRAPQLRQAALARIAKWLPESVLEADGYFQLARDAVHDGTVSLEARRRALALFEGLVGRYHSNVTDLHVALGQQYLVIGNTDEAEGHLRASLLVTALRARGVTPALRDRWGAYLGAALKFGPSIAARATAEWRRELDEIVAECGPDLEHLPWVYYAAAVCAGDCNQLYTARVWAEAARDGATAETAPLMWLAACVADLLAGVHYRTGEAQRALEYHEQAESLLDRPPLRDWNIPKEGLRTSIHYGSGLARAALGDIEGARLRLAQARDRWCAGPDQQLAARALHAYATNERATGRIESAAGALDEAFCRLAAQPAPQVRWMLHALRADLRYRSGEFPSAETDLRIALDLLKLIGEHESANAGETECELGRVLSHLYRHAEAKTVAETGLQRLIRHLGADHPRVAVARNAFAHVLLGSGDLARAAEQAAAAHDALQRRFGDWHRDTVVAGGFAADVFTHLGRTRTALELYQRYEQPARALPLQREELGSLLVNEATLLCQLGDPEWGALYEEGLHHLGDADPVRRTRARQGFAYNWLRWGQSAPVTPEVRARALARSEAEADAVARRNPSSDEPWAREAQLGALYVAAYCQLVSGKDATATLRPLRTALESRDPAVTRWAAHAHHLLGIANLSSGDFTGAERDLRRAVEAVEGGRSKFGPPALDRLDPGCTANPAALLAIAQVRLNRGRDAFTALERGLARNLGEVLGLPPVGIEAIQQRLQPDEALITWIDAPGSLERADLRFACVLRARGNPTWVSLPGTGPRGVWTAEDVATERACAMALATAPNARDRDTLDSLRAAAARLRFAPLGPHLGPQGAQPAARRLLVTPAGPMAQLPLDALVDGYEVALVPSGSFLTRRAAREWARPASVVAIGAPEYALTGVRLRSVPPCVPPALDLRPGDVIRGYAGRPVSTPGEFEGARTAAAVGGAPTVKLIVWRDGHERELETPRWCDPVGSPLVAPVEPDPTAPPRLEWGGAELLAVRAAHDTAPAGRVTELSGARATARNVHALRSAPAPSIDSADLIVFVAHGRRNDTYPLDSALLLAPDAAPGRVTELRAAEVVGWKVRARLVVLSGCWSGLGPPTAADGPVGLAHGFLATGAEGCLVSNWEASDHATALLMSRFHLNLAGRRPGLTQPFPPRAALAEAKRWLRELTGSEIVKLSRLLRTDPSALNRYSDPTVRVADEARPYRDPYYWAGFALVGVPD